MVVTQRGDKKKEWHTTDAHLFKGIFNDTDGRRVSKPYSLTETLFCVYKHIYLCICIHIHIQTMYHTVL